MTGASEFHRLTAHHPGQPPLPDARKVSFRAMDPATRPPQCKRYEGLERVELPADIADDRLSRLLFLSAGVLRVARMSGSTILFRAAGSAGNLQPIEVYVLHGGGLHHYDAPGHALVRLRDIPDDTPPTLILTGVPWRTGWKYSERGFRHLYWDAGSMLAQTLELEPSARVELGFVDGHVAALVGADGVHELPLAVVALDGSTRLPEPAPVPRGFLADDPVEFPLVTEMQRAGALHTVEQVQAWRTHLDAPATIEWSPPGKIDDVIRRRGSTRAFDPSKRAGRDLWDDALPWAARAVPGDFASSTLLEHHAIVHAVQDVEAGARRLPGGIPRRMADTRTSAAALCLGQDLGGTGALTVFHCSDVDNLDDRRYRAALLEAGVVSGRLHLAAFALGYGASGITYFDEEVRRLFQTQVWPLLATTVGTPAYRSRRGGLPRRPTVLHR